MSDIFRDPDAGYAAVLVILLPVVIIGIGELEERLRQRDSPLRGPVGIVRTWVLPLFAVWALMSVLFPAGDADVVISLVATALVAAGGAAALAALAIVIERIRTRPREGRRSVPRLLLAFPRIIVILTILWLIIAGVWNVDLSAALTALGVTSLVVSFALQDTLGGIASGFTLLADQPFQPGDWIEADGVEGQVIDTNWRSTRIQTRDGDLVVVPNGKLAGATITNFDEPARLHRVVVPVQVAYVNSPTDAKEMLLAAARSTPGVLAEPPPNAVVVQIDDPLMGYEVHLWIDDYSIRPRVSSDFGSLVWYHSHRRGVPLPSPAQDLYLWDGERTAADERRDHASILRGLRASTLFEQLSDDELDQLAAGVEAARFARGETVLGPDDDGLVLLEHGAAQLELHLDTQNSVSVLDLSDGDVVSPIGRSETRGHELVMKAIDDCDVLVIPSSSAGGVISRSPALNGALDQLTTGRRRRVQRVLRRVDQQRAAEQVEALGLSATPDDPESADAPGSDDEQEATS
ncbi:MAG: mechanosensitive ion channel family protein [Ilumatobacter fluminis]|uniref:mechanosensitive ion channel family protein n=1 Tax=Ilumatobacter fluminis TaxID=467091 RepID=UPI0032EF9CF1